MAAESSERAASRRASRHLQRFDPAAHETELIAIIDAIARAPELSGRALDRILKNHPKDGRGLFSRAEIIAGYRKFAPEMAWDLEEAECLARLQLRPIRTLSGVTPVTVLTKPFPCPGRCIFCPSDVRMPKSYLADEPGAQRADDNEFDPYLQTWNRLAAYRAIGHPTEKIELIVLGGTWSFLPETYQVWFVRRCFDAMNDFGGGVDGRAGAGAARPAFRDIAAAVDGRAVKATYNQIVSRFLSDRNAGELLHETEQASWDDLAEVQVANEDAVCRNVGLAVETRPDELDDEELTRLRRLGVTKVQIGLQSLSDPVLALNRRGHDVAASRRALKRLRGAGFKIHAHWMPNLLGSTPDADVDDFQRLFDDPDFRPDELKIYPCSLIESAELMAWYERGEWRPYDEGELLHVLTRCLAAAPRYCRLTRVIRDFSAADIHAGNTVANLREVAERALLARGEQSRDIRAREIRGEAFDPAAAVIEVTPYATSVGTEHFIEAVTPDDRLLGFLRLSLPGAASVVAELGANAVVREVHVYGASLAIGRRAARAPQHLGLGRRLVDRAAAMARAAGYDRLSVISAVGTRGYYRSLGFEDGALYQHKPLAREAPGA